MPLDTARRLFHHTTPRRVAAPQALRLVGAVGCRNGPVRPGQPALGRLVSRPLRLTRRIARIAPAGKTGGVPPRQTSERELEAIEHDWGWWGRAQPAGAERR